MLNSLRALVLSIWSIVGVRSPEAPTIATAIATAVAEDSVREPVFASHEEDAAVLAEIVREESQVQTEPRAYSHDAKDGTSCGAFQLACVGLPKTLTGQARKALWLLHKGREVCPESPAAPYLGACKTGLGRRKADARVRSAIAALAKLSEVDVR
jgi:hypothetical protein